MVAMQPKISVLSSLFQSEHYLGAYLKAIQEQSIFAECEFILIANEASKSERVLLQNVQRTFPNQVQVHLVNPVESLGASWNRAWQAAKAPYIAVWNVDDRRRENSLAAQYVAMEAQPNWQLCYGDYVRVSEYGSENGEKRRTPEFSRRLFRRSFPQGGAFWLMRKSLSEKIGYFDEQFYVGPDLDMSLRIAETGLTMGRVDALLGYFTDAEEGLSTREGGRESAVERTAIQLRYGIFDKVRKEYLKAAGAYRVNEILNFGEWRNLDEYLPAREEKLKARNYLWGLAAIRNSLRSVLKRMGLLGFIYALQKRIIGREI